MKWPVPDGASVSSAEKGHGSSAQERSFLKGVNSEPGKEGLWAEGSGEEKEIGLAVAGIIPRITDWTNKICSSTSPAVGSGRERREVASHRPYCRSMTSRTNRPEKECLDERAILKERTDNNENASDAEQRTT